MEEMVKAHIQPQLEEPKFKEGEKILAYHQSLIYEAKVLKAEMRPDPNKRIEGKKKPYYLIHYQGWNDRWDEWVDDTRLLKFTDENREIQQKIKEEHKKVLGKRKDKKDAGKSSKKKKNETPPSMTEKKEGLKMEINIPQSLKNKLIDDWESIVHEKNLVPLPRNPSVAQILYEYAKSKPPQPGQGEFDEVAEGVKAYFDRALGTLLLYKFERQQYSEILKSFPSKPMSEIYGVEHLLRLFVRLPEMISTIEMEEETVAILSQGIKEILKYINKNLGTLFLTEYNAATPIYIRMATT
jgi:mortality factor 4-like protein 1